MTDTHPAEKAFQEAQSALMDKYGKVGPAEKQGMRMVRDRWIEATGAADDPTHDVSVPSEYVDDSTL